MGHGAESDFADFYAATWPRTLACTYALTGDRGAAEEIAQEAYVKAWSHWGKVSRYDQPAAWVRQVATRLSVSRWRRSKVAATWLARNRQPSTAAPPDETTTALVRALQQIPEPQRRAIVLHHLADLPVDEVARIEHSPVGTIKARLSRGRSALAQSGIWLGDIWSVRIGDERAQLELAAGAGNADSGTAEVVAEALVAGLRDGWTQSVEDVEPRPRSLPAWPDIDLEGALAGWESPTRAAPSTTPAIPCLDEQLYVDVEVSGSGSSPRGVSYRITGYAEETTGPARVADMVHQFRTCSRGDVQLGTLPNGVHLATYDLGGPEGRGALWFAANGDRAGFVGVSRADRRMPLGVREDVGDALHTILRLPWD